MKSALQTGMLSLALTISAGCKQVTSSESESSAITGASNSANSRTWPARPQMRVRAEAISNQRVRFTVETNLPTPLDVLTSVNLKGQNGSDVYIGYDQHTTLTGPTSVFVLDTSQASRPLPQGDYEAEVYFNPRWISGEEIPFNQEVKATFALRVRGSGETRHSAERTNERQRWLMSSFEMNSPWNEAEYVRRLGRFEKSQSELSQLHDAYYFPEADVTLLVNRLRREVTIYRIGRASQ